MARTHLERLAAAEAIADRLANRDQEGTVWQSAEPLRRVAEASHQQVEAEAKVTEAIKAAREAGFSWSAIGMMFGVSKQTAQQRFGKTEADEVA